MSVLFHDDFAEGLRTAGPDAVWTQRPAGTLPEGDGRARVTPDGLVIEPTGSDPATGLPAFVVPPEGPDADHVRWVALGRPTQVPEGGALTFSATLSAQLFHTDRHPFGDAVTDPDGDLRCGSAALIALDRDCGLILDVALTNGRVWALYGRVPKDGAGGFSYAIPVADRKPGDTHACAIEVDPGAGRARWILDGTAEFAVDRLGLAIDAPAAAWTAGPLAQVRPRALCAGLGLLAAPLFGQGARLTVKDLTVESRASAVAAHPVDVP
ncbi:DUF6081 family protein [Streptomyces sp. NPDC059639]|uniref:DUF6081 family protein n=1 Tax=Streptomyces sp. NPDC059639 TaxID=3346891 RepID=UPI0036911278